jgi:hypothetical protein
LLYGQGAVEQCDAWLCGILAELLWLSSVQGDPTVAVFRRRFVIRLIASYANSSDTILYHDICAIIQFFVSTSQLLGNLATKLFNTLNAKEPETDVFTHRSSLCLLIRDILDLPPEEISSADKEGLSDLLGRNGGVTELPKNDRDVVHGNPTEQEFAAAVQIQGSPALQQASIQETGGYSLPEVTPQDAPQQDLVVASFLAGKFEMLRATHDPEVLVSALTSSVTVMRSLLSLEHESSLIRV